MNIQLKTKKEFITLSNGERKEIVISTTNLIRNAIDSIPKEGVTASEMRNRIKILDKLDNAIEKDLKELELPEELFKYLGEITKDMKWTVISSIIVDFDETFNK